MAGTASAHQAAAASREETGQQRADRTRRTSADPQRAQQGATAAAADAPAALQALSRLQQLANASPQVAQLRRLQALADGDYTPVAQLAGGPEEEELVQGKFATAQPPPQLQQAPRANNTGLPDQLKSGIESLSGLSMDHVRVHYNSSQPAQLNALAYAQGSDIHLAPGQEQHLPHEAWHVVQQAQGRVRPTMQMAGGVAVSDDAGLEREADAMGAQAGTVQRARHDGQGDREHFSAASTGIVQRVVYPNINAMWAAVAPTFTVANIMTVVNGNAELAAHYQAVIGHLNMMNFVQVANAEPAAAYAPNLGGTYDINYDIPANQLGRFAQEEFFVGAIIHEMGHVASSQLYDTQIGPGRDFHIANMHLPALVGAPFAGELFGPNQMNDPVLGMNVQEENMDANWNVLENILTGSNDFSTAERQLLQGRINYGRGASPYAHYDTVLADILFYLQYMHMDATHFYAQATAMMHEANNRRTARAGAVANVALVAAPAQDTAILHTAVGLMLNDARWSAKGEALIGHKTPAGIRRLRTAFAAKANMREALDDVRAAAAVISAAPSPHRIPVTQQAYQALMADDRTAGIAPTIVAVNAVIAAL
jgi:hypothetical protein